MWIARKLFESTTSGWEAAAVKAMAQQQRAEGEKIRLEIENTRLRSDLDWFKHRLNHVERERGQLIQAAIGVKISVPEFVPAMDNPEDALNSLPDLGTVGGDALDQSPRHEPDSKEGVDFSMLPGYGRGGR